MIGALLGGSSAAAAEPRETCMNSYEQAQRLRRDGELRAARAALHQCLREDVCPTAARADCAHWLREVDVAMPSIVLGARLEGGDSVDARVWMDGALFADRLDGRGVEVNPGSHLFRFETPGRAPIELRVVVAEGERMRPIVATWPSPPAPAAPSPPPKPATAPVQTSRVSGAGPWVLGAVGGAALASFVYFAATGVAEKNDLEKRCSPFCGDDEVDGLRARFIAADVSLGLAVACFAGAAVLHFARVRVTRGGLLVGAGAAF